MVRLPTWGGRPLRPGIKCQMPSNRSSNMANLASKQTKLRNASHDISNPSQNHPCYSTYSSLTHSPHTSLSQTQPHTHLPKIQTLALRTTITTSTHPPTHPSSPYENLSLSAGQSVCGLNVCLLQSQNDHHQTLGVWARARLGRVDLAMFV